MVWIDWGSVCNTHNLCSAFFAFVFFGKSKNWNPHLFGQFIKAGFLCNFNVWLSFASSAKSKHNHCNSLRNSCSNSLLYSFAGNKNPHNQRNNFPEKQNIEALTFQ